MTHHRIELVERVDDVLDAADGLMHRLREKRNLVLGVGNELVKRRIEETDRDGLAVECLEELLEVVLLIGKNLRERETALLDRVGADHFAERRDTALREEHVLGTAKPDALGAELAGLLGVARRIGVGADFKFAELVGPHHDATELADDGRVDRRDDAVVDIAGRAVDGEPVALLEGLAGKDELLVLLIHDDFLTARNAALAHAAGYDGRVGRHASADGQDTLGGLHALNVLGRSLETHENDLLAATLPRLGVGGREDDLSAGGAGRRGKTAADRLSLLEGDRVKLGMKKRIKISGVDHENGLFLGAHTLVDEIARDLERGLSRALAVASLEHEELLVLDRELHVLHVAIVGLELLADILELLEDVGHNLLHLRNRHRSADAGDDVFALRVHEKLTHKFSLARRGIARKGDARAGLVVKVSERHHLDVDGGAPAVGNVVVAAVDIGAGVVPAAEHGLDRLEKLLLRVGREVLADLSLVLGLELTRKFLKIVGGKFDVELNALLLFHFVDELFKILLTDLHNDVGEHLDKAAVAVPRPAGVLRLRGERLDDLLVETEVENRIHHTRHRRARAGADRNEKRILGVAELLAGGLLELVDIFHHLRDDVVTDLLAVVVVARAGLGRDREALGNGKPQSRHLGEVGALAAEKFAHVGVAFGLSCTEEIDILCLCFHFFLLFSLVFVFFCLSEIIPHTAFCVYLFHPARISVGVSVVDRRFEELLFGLRLRLVPRPRIAAYLHDPELKLLLVPVYGT